MRDCNKCVYHTSGECNKWDCEFTTIEDVRNNAVDDFESKLIMHFADWKLSNAPFNDDETDRTREIICETIENAICGVKEIADKLKEVKKNANGLV